MAVAIHTEDLIVRFDSTTGGLLLLKPKVAVDGMISELTPVHMIPQEVLRDASPETAERAAGFEIIGCLSIQLGARITNRDYKALSESAHSAMLKSLHADVADSQNGEARYMLARALIANLSDKSSLQDIEEIESLLKLSAEDYREAQDYLTGMWAKLRAVWERRLARGDPS